MITLHLLPVQAEAEGVLKRKQSLPQQEPKRARTSEAARGTAASAEHVIDLTLEASHDEAGADRTPAAPQHKPGCSALSGDTIACAAARPAAARPQVVAPNQPAAVEFSLSSGAVAAAGASDALNEVADNAASRGPGVACDSQGDRIAAFAVQAAGAATKRSTPAGATLTGERPPLAGGSAAEPAPGTALAALVVPSMAEGRRALAEACAGQAAELHAAVAAQQPLALLPLKGAHALKRPEARPTPYAARQQSAPGTGCCRALSLANESVAAGDRHLKEVSAHCGRNSSGEQ